MTSHISNVNTAGVSVPAPDSSTCMACFKKVRSNYPGLVCTVCTQSFHTKCVNVESRSDWFCTNCMQGMFPFNNIVDDLEFYNAIVYYGYLSNL